MILLPLPAAADKSSRKAGVFAVGPDGLPVHRIHLVEQQADLFEQSSNVPTVCPDPSLELEHLDSVAYLIQGCIHDQEFITADADVRVLASSFNNFHVHYLKASK